ncbi:helix-turn-helix transcriptional regulator [Microbispora sp. H13382]|uniref:ArsR/SmtB family transcription factor n=1 Tax=Microbispora sp. H13382 TaxID=2729112 RepID=UPI001600A7FB|nr:winged helix-turn-helix domain-containing protein [Microbispora sp. H13382]
MGWWLVNADTLAESRFVISPLAEATACLWTLEKASGAHPGEREWLDEHLPAYRARLAGDPITALLLKAARGRNWTADFLTPAPTGEGDPAFEEELSRVRATPPEIAHADIEVALRGPLPTALRRYDLPERAAGLLEWVWTRTVLPDWPRRRRIMEADVVARVGHLSQGGWAAALNDMCKGMRWLGGNRLQINTYDYPPRRIGGARLMFVPVTQRQAWTAWTSDRHYALVYPCSGTLAEPDRAPAPEALGRLLGPARARVLVLLAAPKSTTHLVALTGQGLGSVGRHLRVLLDAGLVRHRRAGRSVLYYRTPLGDALAASDAEARTAGEGPGGTLRPSGGR